MIPQPHLGSTEFRQNTRNVLDRLLAICYNESKEEGGLSSPFFYAFLQNFSIKTTVLVLPSQAVGY